MSHLVTTFTLSISTLICHKIFSSTHHPLCHSQKGRKKGESNGNDFKWKYTKGIKSKEKIPFQFNYELWECGLKSSHTTPIPCQPIPPMPAPALRIHNEHD